MLPRPRPITAGFVLGGMLALSLLGVVSSGASVAASGRVSASLSKTSFPAAQAKTVKLVCKFSPASTRWSYVLSLKKGAKWAKMQSVSKKGSFKGSYKMTVKKLFGPKPVKVGQYRVKVSADANSVTRSFKVVKPPTRPGPFSKASPANGATGQPNNPSLSWGTSSNAASYEYCIDTTNNNACDGSWVSTSAAKSAGLSGLILGATYYWQAHAKNAQGTMDADGGSWFSFTVSGPQAGHWLSTGLSGSTALGYGAVTSVFFDVLADQATESGFGFVYSYGTGWCSGINVRSWMVEPSSPIVGGQFQTPGDVTYWLNSPEGSGVFGSGTFNGTFDSPTTAHGTAKMKAWIKCYGGINPPAELNDTETFSWTATWQSAS